MVNNKLAIILILEMYICLYTYLNLFLGVDIFVNSMSYWKIYILFCNLIYIYTYAYILLIKERNLKKRIGRSAPNLLPISASRRAIYKISKSCARLPRFLTFTQ